MATPRSLLWAQDQHTAEKHNLLRSYLDAWWPIILSRFPSATYAEGFAGPGEYLGGEDGSPIVALRSLLAHTDKPWWGKPARLVLVEKRADRLDHLRGALQRQVGALPPNVRMTMSQGTCGAELLPALDSARAWGQPVFAMLDPFNVDVPYEAVHRVGENPSSEVLVTFMSGWLTRWAKDEEQEQGDDLFGDSEWRNVVHQPTHEKKRWLVDLYRERLKQAGFSYRLAFELIDEGGRAFFLVHGTSSERGLEKMKEAMWRVDPERGVRFRDPRDTRQLTFDIEPHPDLGALEHMLADHLEQQGETVTVSELRRWALTETMFREQHIPTVLRSWRDGQRGRNVVALDPPRGQVNRHTKVRLINRPALSQPAMQDSLFGRSPSD